MIVLSDTP